MDYQKYTYWKIQHKNGFFPQSRDNYQTVNEPQSWVGFAVYSVKQIDDCRISYLQINAQIGPIRWGVYQDFCKGDKNYTKMTHETVDTREIILGA